MKQFNTAARRGVGALPNSIDISFEWELTKDHFVEMTAHAPTSGQLALFMAEQAEGGTSSVNALFNFLHAVLEPANYKIIENQLREGLDIEVPIEVINYLVEEWGARPTKARSASSSSRNSTGRRSTGKQRATVSTISPSASTGS